jgi:hypothetical protein
MPPDWADHAAWAFSGDNRFPPPRCAEASKHIRPPNTNNEENTTKLRTPKNLVFFARIFFLPKVKKYAKFKASLGQ